MKNGRNSIDSNKIIYFENINKFTQNYKGWWKIESELITKGGHICFQSNIRLKNLRFYIYKILYMFETIIK